MHLVPGLETCKDCNIRITVIVISISSLVVVVTAILLPLYVTGFDIRKQKKGRRRTKEILMSGTGRRSKTEMEKKGRDKEEKRNEREQDKVEKGGGTEQKMMSLVTLTST